MKSFLSIKEHIIDEDANDVHAITNDVNHQKIQLFLMSFKLFDKLSINSITNFIKISLQHSFIQKLLNAYMKDYEKRIVGLNFKRFK